MSFASPLWLFALALVPLALALYLRARRRAKRYAIRFPALSTLRGAVEAVPNWERHVPAAFALAAIAVLAVALARPRVTYRAAVGQTSMMLVIDHSGSMAANDVQPSRIAAAIAAANAFIDRLPQTARVGAIGFGTSPDTVQAPVTNHAVARALIDSETASGGTDTGDALNLALQLLGGGNRKHPPAAIVLLSDGAANAGPNPATVAQQARRDKIPIYTVALGTFNGVLPNPDPLGAPLAVPPDPQLMQEIATNSGARAFNAQSADELSSIYKHLGTQLGSVSRKREITAEFAIGGLVLLLLAAAGSARWSGRLP
ncbi:MAG: VWA domain-containing protein [Solirubrobacterales bacterium]|nr:VWA domain-containing protein [Solirubrobacterales bacterium]MBV9421742.1 VWA domain-containing protein [Solirubrobacterales bacterium]MBV9800887.1 VWA domain-containing protein [Solirubrobacterales bacterium]